MTRIRPLDGLLVLDFSQYVAGPLASMLLSDLGADVVKIERPGGDAYRHYDPVVPGQSRYFCSLNRGKRSVICDLARPEGREVAAGLIAHADAVVHNFLPSRAAAFGLDAAAVKRINDRAVVCAISAFGSVGPEAGTPGYDLIAQAVAGLLASAAYPGQEVPERLGRMPLADFTTGLLAAVAVLTGLLDRERHPVRDGRGAADFEVSLLGASLTLQAQQLSTEEGPAPPGRFDAGAMREQTAARAAAAELEPFYRCYQTADAFIAVGCLDVAQRRRLLAALGLADPFVENPQRPAADEQERIDPDGPGAGGGAPPAWRHGRRVDRAVHRGRGARGRGPHPGRGGRLGPGAGQRAGHQPRPARARADEAARRRGQARRRAAGQAAARPGRWRASARARAAGRRSARRR